MGKTYDYGETDLDYAKYKANEYIDAFDNILEYDELVNEIYIIEQQNRKLGRDRTDNIPHWLDRVKFKHTNKLDVVDFNIDTLDSKFFEIYFKKCDIIKIREIINTKCNERERYILNKHFH